MNPRFAHASPHGHEVSPGRPWPLGVTPDADGVNVAVWAPRASTVWFCLFERRDDGDVETRVALPYRDGGVWHAHLSGVPAAARYGLRAAGDGPHFDPQKLLIDPYTKRLEAPLRWHPLMGGHLAGIGGDHGGLDPRPSSRSGAEADSASAVPKCVVVGEPVGPDPAANRPQHALEDLVIYEAHVKGLTAAHPDVPQQLRGTYAGLAHPVLLEHLTGLGVNAIELLPLQAFLDDQHLVAKGLTNYWGYQPISMLAPEPRYAHADADADAELRRLVHTMHEKGIEVIVDVVFNHSGEGDEHGPTLSFRGLHDVGYYRLGESGSYVNDTGTGNTLAVDRPMVLRLVLDSLRHWAERYGVDGFRFDLAATLGRTDHGFDASAAFFQAVQQDPVLAGLKLIAEPWDIGPGGYQLGRFPHPWSEWNDRFRDGVRRAWRGDSPGLAELGSRLLGSAEHFDHSDRAATSSINFLTAHDGFTLADTVSYTRKHNEANGEQNRDGHDENHSDNLGVEGPTNDAVVLAARSRRVRAMLATLLVSQGVPMLLAGDECGNSQRGNNNAYAQDNEIGWVDWGAADHELLGFARRLVALRRRLPVLRQRTFLHGGVREDGYRDIVWRLADGSEPTYDHWHDPACRTLVAQLRGAAGGARGELLPGSVLVMLNVGEDAEVRLPSADEGRGWHLEIDTARLEASGTVEGSYSALAQSVVVLSDCEALL